MLPLDGVLYLLAKELAILLVVVAIIIVIGVGAGWLIGHFL